MTIIDKKCLSPNLLRLTYQFWRNQAESTDERMAYFYMAPPPSAQKKRLRPGQALDLDVWTRIMHFCDKHGVDPMAFVRQQLARNLCLGDFPAPSQLLDERRVRRYRKMTNKKNVLQNLAMRGRLAQQYWESGTVELWDQFGYESHKAASIPALLDMAEEHPLFVYCMALRVCPKKTSSDMLQRAALQYTEFPQEYDEVWAKVLPWLFGTKARLIYVSMLAHYDQVAKDMSYA